MSKAFLVVAFAGVCSAANFDVGLPFTGTDIPKIVSGLDALKEAADAAVNGTSTCNGLVEQMKKDGSEVWELVKAFECDGAEVNVTVTSTMTEKPAGRSAGALADETRHMVNLGVESELSEADVLTALRGAAAELGTAVGGTLTTDDIKVTPVSTPAPTEGSSALVASLGSILALAVFFMC